MYIYIYYTWQYYKYLKRINGLRKNLACYHLQDHSSHEGKSPTRHHISMVIIITNWVKQMVSEIYQLHRYSRDAHIFVTYTRTSRTGVIRFEAYQLLVRIYTRFNLLLKTGIRRTKMRDYYELVYRCFFHGQYTRITNKIILCLSIPFPWNVPDVINWCIRYKKKTKKLYHSYRMPLCHLCVIFVETLFQTNLILHDIYRLCTIVRSFSVNSVKRICQGKNIFADTRVDAEVDIVNFATLFQNNHYTNTSNTSIQTKLFNARSVIKSSPINETSININAR